MPCEIRPFLDFTSAMPTNRHGGAWPGHPRLPYWGVPQKKWITGTRPAMTIWVHVRQFSNPTSVIAARTLARVLSMIGASGSRHLSDVLPNRLAANFTGAGLVS